ncbi:hypothetical protein [Myceligenerans pegani]|uniref:Secreted protein n=1 Tax=Myceligenerans pegani TaxID=2776917 RepID=A0ABR9N3T5_9MICO|nr:hypothetical protein [Myceligenerans sp. TRM 65318]MBE1878325.1 hypothetical protein [Myceligenerans sp. TRM 65318]MBE3020596.1 hypothetical protein [Myceligenerans sp. TRM 65318]
MAPISPSVRLLILAAALLTSLAVAGCGSTEPVSCDSPGDTFTQRVPVHHADDSWDEQVVFLVCTPDETVVIVDVNGDDYRSLAEFQTGNEIFDYGDELLLRKDFPAVNTREGDAEDLETMTVPARVSTAWVWWLVVGGATVVAVVIAGPWYWLRRRRRTRESRDSADVLQPGPEDKPEPDVPTT